MELIVMFELKKRPQSGITCNLRRALLRYLEMSVMLRTVGKEEGLFTCRAKHVISRISVK